jgi:hypothetical protein
LNTRLFTDIVADASPEQDLLAGTGTLYGFEADNSQNTVAVYLKFYDALTVTVGTDAPTWVMMLPAGEVRKGVFGSRGTGRAFATGVSLCCVTTGGTGGVTAPINPVKVSLATS